MTDEDSIAREHRRLRGLIALARETGVPELRVESHDMPGVHIRLGPTPKAAEASERVDPDERAELDEEEAHLAKMSAEERAHNRYWTRITRSSGAPIPPFRMPKEATQ